MVTQSSMHQVEEEMVEATAAMAVYGLGTVASGGEKALEAVPDPVEVEMEGMAVEVQEEVGPEAQEEVDLVVVETEDTLHQAQQDLGIILILPLKSSESNPT